VEEPSTSEEVDYGNNEHDSNSGEEPFFVRKNQVKHELTSFVGRLTAAPHLRPTNIDFCTATTLPACLNIEGL
jgi:hypothetical protein